MSARLIKDSGVEAVAGLALFLVAAYLVYDAYEGRGHARPFLARLLP